MNISTDLIVLRNRKTGSFLQGIKNMENSLATRASFVGEIRGALTLPYDSYLKQRQEVKSMARMHNCEIIRVKAEYELTYPNGSEVLPVEDRKSSFFNLLKAFMEEED